MTSEEFTPQPKNSLPGASEAPAELSALSEPAEAQASTTETTLNTSISPGPHERPRLQEPPQAQGIPQHKAQHEMPPSAPQGLPSTRTAESGTPQVIPTDSTPAPGSPSTSVSSAASSSAPASTPTAVSPRHLSLSGVRPLNAEPTRPTPAFSGFLPPSSTGRATPSTPNPSTQTPTAPTQAVPTQAAPATPATPQAVAPQAVAPLPPLPTSHNIPPQAYSGESTSEAQDAPPFAYIPSEQIFATPDILQPQPRKKRRWGRIILIIFLIIGLLLTSIGATLLANKYLNTDDRAIVPASTDAPPSIAATPDGTPNWEGVSAAVASSVVTINVSAGNSGSVGSGVIYTSDGLILTNDHVINIAQNGGEIRVTLTDQRYYAAEIVGTDPSTDLAVIRLINPPSDLTVASFGTSDNLRVGQPVMAIGAPLGLSNTVTTGIISALNRPVEVSADRKPNPHDPFAQLDPRAMADDTVITNAIQIDASINPGNSGGPLFNAQGQVIGINSSIASIAQEGSDSAGSIGLGFAIPVDLTRKVADQLVNKGRVAHAVLGVTIKSVALEVKGTTHLGAQIDTLTPDAAADRAGLHSGDLITHIDKKRVASAKALQGVIRGYTAGDEITVTIVRDGETLDMPVVLQERE